MTANLAASIDSALLSQQSLGVVAVKNLRKSGAAVRIRLPVTIGSSSKCDITVNSNSVAKFARIIYSTADGKLNVADPSTGEHVPLAALANYGIAVSGPYATDSKSQFSARLQRFLAAEAIWYTSKTEKFKSLTFGRFEQNKRLSIWAGTASLLLAISSGVSSMAPKGDPDLSREPLPMEYASILTKGYGSVPAMRSYANGITFALVAPKGVTEQPHTLSFDAKGLEADKEITVVINGKELYSSRPDKECVNSYCPHSVLIPLASLSEGENSLYFAHWPADSDYVLRNIIVATLTTPSAAEMIAIQRSFAQAKRGFEERGISHENILSAKRELEKLKELLNRRLGVEELQAETSVLTKNVQDELIRMRDELWFSAQKDKQLGNFKAAKEKFEGLLELHPDAGSKEHKQVRQQLAELAELVK